MRTINCTTDQAEYGLMALTCHVPAAVALGRPTVALHEGDHVQYATEEGFLWLYRDRAERMCAGDDGVEITTWQLGKLVEVGLLH